MLGVPSSPGLDGVPHYLSEEAGSWATVHSTLSSPRQCGHLGIFNFTPSLVTCIPSSPQRKCKVDLLEGQHCPSIHCRKASLLAHLNIHGRQAISRSKAFLSLTARWLQGSWESQTPCLTSAVTKNRTCNKSAIPFFCQSGRSEKALRRG